MSDTENEAVKASQRLYFRRHCYNKPWRCPGWSGGGWTTPRVQRCDGGSLDIYRDDRPDWLDQIRFSRCDTCGVRAIPFATRWLDPTWLGHKALRLAGRIKDWVADRAQG